MKPEETIKAYYKAFETKDKSILEEILTADFKFKSSFSNFSTRADMLKETWPMVLKNQSKLVNLELFRNDNKFIAQYTLQMKEPISMCECITFRGKQISEIEVFTGSKVLQN